MDEEGNSQDTRIRAVHVFSQEILLQRSLAMRIILQCLVLVVHCQPMYYDAICRHTRYAEKAPGLMVSCQHISKPSVSPLTAP